MRLLIILCLSLATFGGELLAQGQFSIGLKGVPQNTWLLNQSDSDTGTVGYVSTWNAAYGLSFGYYAENGIGVVVDFLLSEQGQKRELKTPGGTVLGEFDYQLSYLKIPVLFAFTSDPTKNAMFYGNVGPQFSFLQDASLIDLEDNVAVETDGFELKDAYESSDISAVVALGGRFKFNESLGMNVGLRIDYGLTDAENKAFELDGLPFYASNRPTTANATAGLEIGIHYVFGQSSAE